MIPDFAGKVIELVKIDYALFLWTADDWEIRVAGPVLVGGPDTEPTEIDVDGPDSPLPPELKGLAGSTIGRMLVGEDGRLHIETGDRQLDVPPGDGYYEPWQIAGRDGERLICTPSGELAYFPPVARDHATTPADDSPSVS